MKIVIAPDSFKGCLNTIGVCQALARGVRRVAPDADVVAIPMADGGEGTIEALVASGRGRIVTVTVTGPLGEPVEASYGVLDEGNKAVIEMAAASGLPLVPVERRNPMQTTTFGTGELIRHALQSGRREFIIGIGGSATTDGGAGMAQALGVQFQVNGVPVSVPMTGALLGSITAVDATALMPEVRASRFVVACDVDNPLLGPRGAARVYGPQKGATPEQCETLDRNLEHYIERVEQETGRRVRDIPGAGAAGGLGAGLMAFLQARLTPGVDIVLEQTDFLRRIQGASLILTGEGQIDFQTAFGKTPAGVARAARTQRIPVVAVAGSVGRGADALRDIGIEACFPICPGPMTLEESMRRAPELLEATAERIMRLYALAAAPSRIG